MNIKQIRELISLEQYRLTRHARDECRIRQITLNDVEETIANGQIVETHVDEEGFNCFLIAGERFNGDVAHIASKVVDDVLQINTVYYPHTHLWDYDKKRKRR